MRQRKLREPELKLKSRLKENDKRLKLQNALESRLNKKLRGKDLKLKKPRE